MIYAAILNTMSTIATAFGRGHPGGYRAQEAKQLSQTVGRRVVKWGLSIGAIFAVAHALIKNLDAVISAVLTGATAASSAYIWLFMPGPEGASPRVGYLAPWGLLLAVILLTQAARIQLIIHAVDERHQPKSPTLDHAHRRSNAIRERKQAQDRVLRILKHAVICLFLLVAIPLLLTTASAVREVAALSGKAVLLALLVMSSYLVAAVMATYDSDWVLNKVVMALLPKSMHQFNDSPDQMLASLCAVIDRQFEGQE